jgi:hypothetical protein
MAPEAGGDERTGKMSEKRKRRIKGESFWRMHGMLKQIESGQEALKQWQDERLAELKLYRDQVNWSTAAVYDPMVEIEDGKIVRGTVIARLPAAVVAAHDEKIKALQAIDRDLGDYRDQLAKRLGLFPKDIDIKTGEVSDDDYDELEELAAKE